MTEPLFEIGVGDETIAIIYGPSANQLKQDWNFPVPDHIDRSFLDVTIVSGSLTLTPKITRQLNDTELVNMFRWWESVHDEWLRLEKEEDRISPTTYRKSKISNELRNAVLERDGCKCNHCRTTEHLTMDHIYPESLGGETTIENLQTLCKRCNSKKGTKI